MGRPENKTPPKRGFIRVCGWLPQNTLCYVNAKSIRDRRRTRNSGTDFDVLSMDRLPKFVHKILFMHTVFIYTEGVRSERGAAVYRRNEVPAETGGAVSALTLK